MSLTIAQKRAALTKVKPVTAESTVRELSVAVLGSSVSATKSFFSDMYATHQYAEATRLGLIK
jgi:hypothetical protein